MKTLLEKPVGSRHVRGLEMKGTLMLLLLTLSGAAQAQFSYLVTNGAVTITGYTGPGGAVDIPDTIGGIRVTAIEDWAFCWCTSLTSVTIPDGVTRIGDFAFWGTSLTNVIIPSSVTSIGDEAFGACTRLMAITVDPLNRVYSSVDGVLLNKSQTTLLQCPGAKSGSYTVPDSVSSIRGGSWWAPYEWGGGAGAFGACTSLTNITIGNSVTSIGVRAFENCTSLTSVMIPSSVTNLGFVAFGGCANLTAITVDPVNRYYSSVDGVLFNKNQTTLIQAPGRKAGSYTIPSSVTSIEAFAFSWCTNLTHVMIPDSITSIGEEAFAGCTGLTSFTIPSSVTSIGYSAFVSCTGLKNVSIGNSLTSIGPITFAGCSSLTSITIPNSVTNIGYEAFVSCERLVNVTIPGSVTSIGWDAFGGCSSLTSITIPNGVTSIEWAAFGGCSSLTNVTIPNSVTNIGYEAFVGCSSLTSVMIPNRVTDIGDRAFLGCSSLRGVYFQGNAPSLGDRVFSGCSSTVYYLPGTTGWGASFGGRPTTFWVLPAPLILSQGPDFGLRTNGFGFIISWATNTPVVVEASANPASGLWSPVATNALTGGWSDFTDVHWRDYPIRFYRVRPQ